MPKLNLNSTLSRVQQLHCLTGNVLNTPDLDELTLYKELTQICNKDALFLFTPSEQEAAYAKSLELKKASTSQVESKETNALLLEYLLLIVSRSKIDKDPNPLLAYANQIASTQDHLDFVNIGKMLRHLARFTNPNSEDTQPILNTLRISLIANRENGKVMTLTEVSSAFFGLMNADFSDPIIQDIVDELTWHTNQNIPSKAQLSCTQLAQSFFGFGKMQWNQSTENALEALFPYLQHFTQTKNWLDGRQLEMVTSVIKHIPVDHAMASKLSSEITQHIEGNATDMNWFKSTWIESILQNLHHLKSHSNGFLTLVALFPHIQHTKKEYPLTFKGMDLTLSILSTPFGIFFTEKTLPALLGHLESLYMEKSEEDFRSWLDHVLSPFSQYPTQSEIISAFRQKALAISEPENNKEDSLFDDPNSDSPRTLTTGSDASLTEEETHHDTSPHSIHSDHNIVM